MRRIPVPTDPTFRGPWFDTQTAAAYVGNKSMGAWYVWRRAHGIVPRGNGTVAKADLDRALKVRSRRGRHPHTLGNLLGVQRRDAARRDEVTR